MKTERVLPCPATNVENRAYWDAASDGRLLVKHCLDCGRNHHYPRALCPHCFSDRTQWRDSSGVGTLYSFSVMRRVAAPYCIAYIALDDGVTMMSNVVDCDFDALAIGQRVKVAFRPSDGPLAIPVFVPA